MWIPRLSLKSLLAIVTGLCLYFVVVTFAARGNAAAQAVSAALGSLVLAAFVYALLFLAALFVATLPGIAGRKKPPASPFATDRPPPQVLPPGGAD